MSSPAGKRDVIRLRTFADDVSRAKETKGIGAAAAVEALVNEAPEQSKGIFHKVEKKALNITDTSHTVNALDSDGIQFDEETATQVVDNVYEEHKTIKDDAKQRTADVEIRKTDSIDVIAAPGSATTPSTPTGQFTINPKPSAASPTAPMSLKAEETIDQINAPIATIQDHTVHSVSKSDLAAGEIVSDKKRDRFKLFPAIIEATNNWFTETKDQIEEAQREKHTVSKIETRVDTIKAAAQPKTLAPDEDFDAVAERLRQQKRTVRVDAPVIVKPKLAVTASWTHTIPEPGEATSTEQTQAAETAPVVEATSAPTTPEPVPPTPEVTAPEPVAPLSPAPEPVPPTLVAAATPTPAPTQSTGSGFSLPTFSLPTLSVDRERLPSPLFAIVIVIVAIAAGVGTSLFFFWQPTDTGVIPEATTNPLFTAQQQTNIQLAGAHHDTMQALLSAVSGSANTLYLYLTRPDTGEVVAPHEVMAFLAPQAPGAFTRSITNVSFGSYNNQPFIVLRANNFDNAFSGMLAWEQTMSADLAPLFGPVVTESFDPQARTDNQTRGAFFRDIVASNLSGRLLTNARGEDRILYTFIDRQTIIITVDRLQLTNVLPLIR